MKKEIADALSNYKIIQLPFQGYDVLEDRFQHVCFIKKT